MARGGAAKSVDNQTRIVALVVMLFGFMCFVPLIQPGVEKLILIDAPSLISKYFLVIISINGGVFFIIAGIVLFKGILISYHSDLITKKERAKTELFSIIGASPFFISASVTMYQMSSNVMWKIIWSFALVYVVFISASSLRILRIKSGKTQKRESRGQNT